MNRIKSLIVTVILMALLWWCYELTDMYAWGAHQVLEGILTVAGFLAIGGGVYVFLRFGEPDPRLLQGRKKQPYIYVGGGLWQK